jgi:hypothetical protein
VRIVYRGGDSSKEGKTHLWKEGLSTESETCLRMGRLTYGGGGLCTEGRDLSTDGETRLLRGRLVYRAGGLSTERETRLQRARLFCGGTESIQRERLVYGGGDSSAEGENRLRRGRHVYGGRRLVYGGEDLSTEGETRLQRGSRLGTILDTVGNVQNCPNTVCVELIT